MTCFVYNIDIILGGYMTLWDECERSTKCVGSAMQHNAVALLPADSVAILSLSLAFCGHQSNTIAPLLSKRF